MTACSSGVGAGPGGGPGTAATGAGVAPAGAVPWATAGDVAIASTPSNPIETRKRDLIVSRVFGRWSSGQHPCLHTKRRLRLRTATRFLRDLPSNVILRRMRLLASYLRQYRGLIALALLLATINQVFSLLDPLIFRHVIDEYATRFAEYTTGEFFRGEIGRAHV